MAQPFETSTLFEIKFTSREVTFKDKSQEEA